MMTQLLPYQRWAHALVVLLGGVSVLVLVNLRANVEDAQTTFTDPAAGITARYPLRWLFDSDGPYVFRVRNMDEPGFKTTFQVALLPVGQQTTLRNVRDTLTLQRAQQFVPYRVQRVEPVVLTEDLRGEGVEYIFVSTTTNTFLEDTFAIVVGYDVIVIRRGQAIVVTLLADQARYAQELQRFRRFVDELEL